jgi:predicted nucleic acid-binding protein
VARASFEEVPLLAGNLVHDAHTAILMREHGLKVIYTRDTGFHRFPWIEVRDPLAG